MSLMEVLVALMLLSSTLSVSLTLIVRHGRWLAAQRNYRVALDEVSNQMERITALSGNEAAEAVKQLNFSPFAAERLPNSKLVGELTPADGGQRVTVRLISDASAGPNIAMAGWLMASQQASSRQTARGR